MLRPPYIPILRRAPSLLLLTSIVVLTLATPLLEGKALQEIILGLLFALVLLAAIYAVTGEAWHRRLAASLAVLWLGLFIWRTVSPSLQVALAADMVFIVLGSFTIVILLWRVVSAERVDFEILCASPSIYLLLAMTWAVSYRMVEALSPGSFEAARGGVALNFLEFHYFSLITITTLGYGDITPIGAFARIWSTLEAVVGVFYMAVLVARLVSLYRR